MCIPAFTIVEFTATHCRASSPRPSSGGIRSCPLKRQLVCVNTSRRASSLKCNGHATSRSCRLAPARVLQLCARNSRKISEKEFERFGAGLGACHFTYSNSVLGKVAPPPLTLPCAAPASRACRPMLFFFLVLLVALFWFRETLQTIVGMIKTVQGATKKQN